VNGTGRLGLLLTNKPRGVLYTGVTANIARRMHEHRTGVGSKFCKRYNLDKLVYGEEHLTIQEAISREKAVKAWKRAWKIELIETVNPLWDDLSEGLL
jgi:putative endonuclease